MPPPPPVEEEGSQDEDEDGKGEEEGEAGEVLSTLHAQHSCNRDPSINADSLSREVTTVIGEWPYEGHTVQCSLIWGPHLGVNRSILNMGLSFR